MTQWGKFISNIRSIRVTLSTGLSAALSVSLSLGLLFPGVKGLCDASKSPPSIATQIKPSLWKRLIEDKEIIVNASLNPVHDQEIKKYSFYAGMLVGADLKQVRQVITNYALYAQVIPYVSSATYSDKNHILNIEGGIWKFRLRSEVLFDEMMDRWVHYNVVGGHFTGLAGDIYFESLGEKGTVVYFKGEQLGYDWPPQFVIERGAEIVFEYTARRLRSLIEAQKKIEKGAGNGRQQEFPQPRSHI